MKPTVVVRLMGGLGNQLFQYATGRALAQDRDADLELDLGFFGEQTQRSYALDRFRIEAGVLRGADLRAVDSWRIERAGGERSPRRLPWNRFRNWSYVAEQGGEYRPDLTSLPGSLYLDGYWQCEKYFAHIAPALSEELTLREPPDAPDRDMLDRISISDAVAVHVRRRDYVLNPATNAYHGTCPPEYYERAFEWIGARIGDPHFFFFSDDPGWTRDTLRPKAPCTHVTHNLDRDDHADLRLMSACKHFIIANSSFSWWGAWLAQAPEKQVVAPERWYLTREVTSRDLVPEAWIRL